MMKKITVAVAIAFAAVFAKADFLFWQVSDVGEFSMASLSVQANGQVLEELEAVGAEGVDFESVFTGTTTGLQQTDISAYSGSQYTFFVEMLTYNAGTDSFTSNGTGYRWTYDELVSSGYISAGGISTPDLAAFGGLNMGSPVPEPTSGILLLVGGALLSLRRRRAV